MLSFRENTLLRSDSNTPGNTVWAADYDVTVYAIGGIASAISSGLVITFDGPHGFRVGDKWLQSPKTTNNYSGEAVSAVTATTITMPTVSTSVAVGDKFVNLGPDTSGSSTPAFDASPMAIYTDSAAATSKISNARVTADTQGVYSYWHNGDGRFWELVRNSLSEAIDVITGFASVPGRFNVVDFGVAGDSDGSPGNGTDDALALEAASLAAEVFGLVYMPEITSRITSTWTVRGSIDSHPNAKLYSDFEGSIALDLFNTPGNFSKLGQFTIPNVFKSSQTWVAQPVALSSDIGVRIAAISMSKVYCQQIGEVGNGFGVGLKVDAPNGPSIPSQSLAVYLAEIKDCAIGFEIDHSASFTNVLNIHDGRFLQSSGEVRPIGTRHVHIADPASGVNITENVNFFGTNLEGTAVEFNVLSFGKNVQFWGCYWEDATIRFDSGTFTAEDNIVHGGNRAASLTLEYAVNAVGNGNKVLGKYVEDFDNALPSAVQRMAGLNTLLIDDAALGDSSAPDDISSGPGSSDLDVVIQSTTDDDIVALQVGVQGGSRMKMFVADADAGVGSCGLIQAGPTQDMSFANSSFVLMTLLRDGTQVTFPGIVSAGGSLKVSGTAATLTSGSGVPSASEPDGSIYTRTGANGGFYIRQSGAWNELDNYVSID